MFNRYQLITYGNNYRGKLGNNPSGHNLVPIDVSTSMTHSALIDQRFDLYTTGDNSQGQLGLGDYADRDCFTKVPGIRAKKVYTAFQLTAVIDLNDNLLTFGHNNHGQLGTGDHLSRSRPSIVAKDVRFVSIYGDAMLFIDNSGDTYVCGRNTSYKLGSPNLNEYFCTPHLLNNGSKSAFVHANYTLLIDMNDHIWILGNDQGYLDLYDRWPHLPDKISEDRYNYVCASQFGAVAIDHDGYLTGFGQAFNPVTGTFAKYIHLSDDRLYIIDIMDRLFKYQLTLGFTLVLDRTSVYKITVSPTPIFNEYSYLLMIYGDEYSTL